MSFDLKIRYEAIHREMVEQFERTAAIENHWLLYSLLGWENLVACAVSYYLAEVKGLHDVRWPFVVVWLLQIFVAICTIKLASGRPQTEESPLRAINKRIWTVFMFLSINVSVLNVVNGQKVFVFLPTLAVLSSFAFTVMASIISRRFVGASAVMFLSGILMAKFPAYGFLIYGTGWFVVLETLGVILLRKRQRFLGGLTRKPNPCLATTLAANAQAGI